MRISYGKEADFPAFVGAVPSAGVGIEIGGTGAMKPRRHILSVTVATAIGDVFLWVQTSNFDSDNTDDHSSGPWGLYNDKHGRYVNGRLAGTTAKLAIGVHNFVIEDLGAFIAVALQTDGVCTATAKLIDIIDSNRSG